MFRKNYFTIFLAAALFLLGNTLVSAQTGMAVGKVELKKADGSVVPLADVKIDVYRIDVKGKLPSSETNKKGEFTILGLLPGGSYALAISAPNVKSDVFPGIKAGDEKITLSVVEGDGRRFTEEEVRQIASMPPRTGQTSGELTAEQKKAQEKYEKEIADIQAKNKDIEKINATISRSLSEGDKQFNAKNYDAAIISYDEGINADPDYAGTAAVLLNKKGSALLSRATDKSNETVKADPAVRSQAMVAVKKDYEDAITAFNRALTLLKSADASDPKMQKGFADAKFNTLEKRKEAFRLMSKTGADRTKGKEAVVAFQEYLDATTDAKIKTSAQLELTDVLMDSQEFDLAITESEKILAQDPNNVNALAVAGLSLINIGYINNDKDKLQQGSNYLQKFTEIAPDTHQYKADAKSLIESLKKEQNVTPQKVTRKKQ